MAQGGVRTRVRAEAPPLSLLPARGAGHADDEFTGRGARPACTPALCAQAPAALLQPLRFSASPPTMGFARNSGRQDGGLKWKSGRVLGAVGELVLLCL